MGKGRPGGPSWPRSQTRDWLGARLRRNLQPILAVSGVLLGLIGAMYSFLLQSATGWIGLGIVVMGCMRLRSLYQFKISPMVRPGLGEHDE